MTLVKAVMYHVIQVSLPPVFIFVTLLSKGSVETKSVHVCPIMNIGIDRWISALKRQQNNNAEQLHFEEEERGERRG